MHFKIFQVLSVLLMLCLLQKMEAAISSNKSDIEIATAEMKAGSYYAFVTLLQLVIAGVGPIPTPIPPSQLTFLMPTDQALADIPNITASSLPYFLLAHSLPLPLRLNNFLHFPTGTFIPSLLPKYMLAVSNHGKHHFFLNNAQIITPNVCRASISIACHGISQVLNASFFSPQPPAPPPSPAPAPEADHPPPPPPPPPPPSPSPSPPSPSPSPSPSFQAAEPSSAGAPTAYTSALLLFVCSIAAFARP